MKSLPVGMFELVADEPGWTTWFEMLKGSSERVRAHDPHHVEAAKRIYGSQALRESRSRTGWGFRSRRWSGSEGRHRTAMKCLRERAGRSKDNKLQTANCKPRGNI